MNDYFIPISYCLDVINKVLLLLRNKFMQEKKRFDRQEHSVFE